MIDRLCLPTNDVEGVIRQKNGELRSVKWIVREMAELGGERGGQVLKGTVGAVRRIYTRVEVWTPSGPRMAGGQ